jgi:hypothetical protein
MFPKAQKKVKPGRAYKGRIPVAKAVTVAVVSGIVAKKDGIYYQIRPGHLRALLIGVPTIARGYTRIGD